MDIFNRLSDIMSSKMLNVKPKPEYGDKIYYVKQHTPKKTDVKLIELTREQAAAQGFRFKRKARNRVRITKYVGTPDRLLVIPNKIGGMVVNEIAFQAFEGTELDILHIPGSIKKMGKCAFAGSTVSSVTIGEGCDIIGHSAFAFCKKLHEVNLPTTIKQIDVCAFKSCKRLSEIRLPWARVGNAAFMNSGLIELYAANDYTLDNGAAFRFSAMHKQYDAVMMRYNRVLLVGNKANIKLTLAGVNFIKGSLADAARPYFETLDLSDCKSVYLEANAMVGADDITSEFHHAKVIMPQGSKPQYFSETITAVYPDGTPCPTYYDMKHSEDGKTVDVNLHLVPSPIPSYSIKAGKAEELHIKLLDPHIYEHGIEGERLRRVVFDRRIEAYGEMFSPLCVNLHEVRWTEYRPCSEDEIRVKYIPSTELIDGYLHKELLKAYTHRIVIVPRVYGQIRHDHCKYFFDRSVIDKVFQSKFFEYTNIRHRPEQLRVNTRTKILIAIDVLRSSRLSDESDTEMYSKYLRTHKRYAMTVCRRLPEEWGEYLDFLHSFYL